ncbi:MlaD family protein [Nocardioides daeguensis]|uniref:MCE family protein n=1 Tax=Nocardioides daeguensis TaxID=908359 RepID=A0ABP6V8B9_9ACTN|nr:MlaD family protein [Nocardioides daeguensis]MBV6726505.1 MCE family protein [Nocardioides daeguensis]MCR1772348.1 MCE family protein [Nocardioides daeguensis]
MKHSLSSVSQRVRNTPGLLRDTTTLVACLVLGVICSAYILSHQDFKAPWTDKFTFSADFDKAPSVRPESLQEVRIAGVQVGRITAAKPSADGLARVTFQIDPDQKVYKNARVVIRTKSPLNVMYATLEPGDPSAGPLPENAVLPLSQTDRAVQPNEVFDKLDDKARAGLTSLLNEADVALASGPRHLGPGLSDTAGAMRSWTPVLDEIAERRAHLSRLVSAMADIAGAVGKDDERIADLTLAAQQTLGALAARDTELAAALDQLPGFADDVKGSMSSVETLSAELDPTLRNLTSASDRLPRALRDVTGTVKAIRKFVRGARPVIERARPLVADLRPLSVNLDHALRDLRPVTATLPAATERIVPWMEDLAAFVYQTSSSFSLYDANGGLGRANVNVDLTNPLGGIKDMGIEGAGQ